MSMTKYGLVAGAAFLAAGCGSSKSGVTSSFSADKPSAIMKVLATSVATTGGAMAGSSATMLALKSNSALPPNHSNLSSSDCSVHGEPVSITQHNDSHYAGLLTYCKMTVDTGDEESVQGVFTGIEAIACMVEHAGPTYDGASHSLTLTFDNNCFTDAKLANIGVTSGTTATATVIASSPASFNSHYDKGIDINVNVGGNHHYTFGTKVDGNVIEVTYFDEDKDQAHKTGAGAGYLDLGNGILRVESRMDRILCTQNSSCGWNRHVRLYSTLTMDGTTVKDPKEVDFLYSNTESHTNAAQGGWDGYLVTASGNLSTTGIKPRGFATSSLSSDSAVNALGAWTENASSTDCFTNTTTTASTCGTGIPMMSSNLKFVMTVGSGYTLPTTWFTSENGLSFTSVSADDDTP